jgi:hypothetical protein
VLCCIDTEPLLRPVGAGVEIKRDEFDRPVGSELTNDGKCTHQLAVKVGKERESGPDNQTLVGQAGCEPSASIMVATLARVRATSSAGA